MEPRLSQSSLPPSVKHRVFKSSALFSKDSSKSSQRCMIHHLLRISWKSQIVTKKLLIHVVTEGEALSSMSKRCGLPIVVMASGDKEVVDIHRIVGGQNLDVPSSVTKYAIMRNIEGRKWFNDKVSAPALALKSHARQWKRLFTETSTNHLHIAKNTGSFLVLVPLLAFLITCITAAIRNRVNVSLKNQQSQKQPGIRNCRSKSLRWRSALSDLLDPDAMNNEHQQDSANLSDNEDQSHTHDNFHTYAKLEDDYQKFLSECGMSNWGYWRGGSLK